MLNAPVSHYLFTAAQSRDIDEQTINEIGIEGFTLMEIAGYSASQQILNIYPELSHGIYLCGKGNNAGDALVIARYLIQHDINASIVFLSGMDGLSPDTHKNFELLKKFDPENKISIYDSWDDFSGQASFDFIIDGMLGTGLDSNLRGDYQKAVQWANQQSVPVFSIDIPTGLHADLGEIMGKVIKADHTFTFGGRKQGFYLQDGPLHTGQVTYCELPFPNELKTSCNTFLIDESWVSEHQSSLGVHKYDTGVLYIIAGSEGLTGAAVMAAKSAWAEGLGAVFLVCPRGLLSVYEHNLPSIIKKPVGEQSDTCFSEAHLPDVRQIVGEKQGAVLLGPGLGRKEETVRFVIDFLSQNNRKTVIDADALWALAQSQKWKEFEEKQWILTPHPGELARLLEQDVKKDYQRLNLVRNFSAEHNVTTLSKGMPGIVSTKNGDSYLTNYDTRYFARAGSGDVLAGKISAYLALDYSPEYSCAQALLNGKKKLFTYLDTNRDLPEPTDFI
ncbi:NAD(P)H-hydrate dehydratase [Aliifodinibius salicampi]|uniref:Bifunctional NAD(P)H-hydrate repair enzyme n=1 Tax=Fodinibius salicampi TaxID=1920655 RepID=A0ABT3Q2A1_9BACT|nr:NAD(P)H-hydrate dehydratase [Fodinibius salicampi]MCW9714239.1 NAD(P)H-hydrate dehydratase [Fodinibius salicampi]